MNYDSLLQSSSVSSFIKDITSLTGNLTAEQVELLVFGPVTEICKSLIRLSGKVDLDAITIKYSLVDGLSSTPS